jgi:hypothetical protein
MKGQGRKQKKTAHVYTREYQERMEATTYAHRLRSQGLYAWADNWDNYAKSPAGTQKPPNYHNVPAMIADGSTDPRMKTYPGTIYSQFGGDDQQYETFMDRVTNPMGSLGGGGDGNIVQQREKTNAELGQILDAKGRPYLLLKKLGELRKEYPEIYYRPKNQPAV